MLLGSFEQVSWQAWLTLGTVVYVLGMLTFSRIAADLVLVSAVVLLLTAGVLDTREAFAGMSNEGMLTVGVLFVVVAGLEATGATAWIVQRLLGRPRSIRDALLRLMLPVSAVSGFLNNTPVVAMFMPAVKDWARQNRIPISKLMMPLSYAAVLGGCCTLIGTSTNLVVNGLLIDSGRPPLGFFQVTWAGLPCALAGIAFLLAAHRLVLPDRTPVLGMDSDPREYTIEMIVEPSSPIVGQTIEGAGLRHLPQVYLMEIERAGEIIPAVSPSERLQANDRLVFVGVVDSLVDLQKIRGLKPATDQVFKLDAPRASRVLIEAVVSDRCPIVGQTIRDGRFRTVYNAAVIAVARSGERIRKKIGDIVLRAGDTLLLEAHPSFLERQRNSQHFYLVSQVQNSSPLRHERAWLAIAILGAMVLAASLEWMSMLHAALIAAGLMLITRCCTGQAARRSVDWQTLISIAASLALGRAIEKTGLAQLFAEALIDLAGGQPWVAVFALYALTLILTELVTNNAAAVLMFPLAIRIATDLNADYMPFVMAVTLAASLGFATPLGYQTHLMVYGPGGYRFTDFLKAGTALDLVCLLTATAVIPLAFPFHRG